MRRMGMGFGALLVAGLLLPACVTASIPPPGPPPSPHSERVMVGRSFYDVLSPYGEWFVLEPYGTVWRPFVTVVGVEFVPYSSGGYWIHTDAGWAFETDWNWGWAVFHYGHWAWIEGPGWVWVPGTEWAPAWVMWRYGGGYVGWYPMPPPHAHVSVRVDWGHWVFVPTPYFTHRDFHRYLVPHHDRYRAYHAATPVDVAHGRPVGPPRHRMVSEEHVVIPEGRTRGPRQVSPDYARTPAGIPVRDPRSFEQTPPGAVVRDPRDDRRERWTQPEPSPERDGDRGPTAPGRTVDRSGDQRQPPPGRTVDPGEAEPPDRTVKRGDERPRVPAAERGENPQAPEPGTGPAQVRPREERGTGGSGTPTAPKAKKPTKSEPPPPQRGDR